MCRAAVRSVVISAARRKLRPSSVGFCHQNKTLGNGGCLRESSSLGGRGAGAGGAPLRTRSGKRKNCDSRRGLPGDAARRETRNPGNSRGEDTESEREREKKGEPPRKGDGGQLKLAQFSHSPVIRGPGIYIIKSRKFLSPLHPHRRCVRALAHDGGTPLHPSPPSPSLRRHPLPPPWSSGRAPAASAFRARFLGATERRIVATIIRRQGSNAGVST